MFEKKPTGKILLWHVLGKALFARVTALGSAAVTLLSTGMTKSWQLEPRLIQLLKA